MSLLENKLHPASSRSQSVIIQARYSGRMSIISRALLCAAGNFLNERNSALTVNRSSVFPVFFLRNFSGSILMQKNGERVLHPREKAMLTALASRILCTCQRTYTQKSPEWEIAHWRICVDGSFGNARSEQTSERGRVLFLRHVPT